MANKLFKQIAGKDQRDPLPAWRSCIQVSAMLAVDHISKHTVIRGEDAPIALAKILSLEPGIEDDQALSVYRGCVPTNLHSPGSAKVLYRSFFEKLVLVEE